MIAANNRERPLIKNYSLESNVPICNYWLFTFKVIKIENFAEFTELKSQI